MVINTDLLKKHMKPEIVSICSNVSYGEYDPDMSMPYAVFTIDDIDVGEREDKQLEVNIYSDDIKELEIIADSIANKFKNYKYINDSFLIFTNVNSRNSMDDDKSIIKRRRILIDIYFYDRSVS
jgi:hypothetical protein